MLNYQRVTPTSTGEEFADAKFAELVPWGKDQTFSGLTHGTPHLGPTLTSLTPPGFFLVFGSPAKRQGPRI